MLWAKTAVGMFLARVGKRSCNGVPTSKSVTAYPIVGNKRNAFLLSINLLVTLIRGRDQNRTPLLRVIGCRAGLIEVPPKPRPNSTTWISAGSIDSTLHTHLPFQIWQNPNLSEGKE